MSNVEDDFLLLEDDMFDDLGDAAMGYCPEELPLQDLPGDDEVLFSFFTKRLLRRNTNSFEAARNKKLSSEERRHRQMKLAKAPPKFPSGGLCRKIESALKREIAEGALMNIPLKE